jgi:alpha-tubulin suppressor-like RCC1 family protein
MKKLYSFIFALISLISTIENVNAQLSPIAGGYSISSYLTDSGNVYWAGAGTNKIYIKILKGNQPANATLYLNKIRAISANAGNTLLSLACDSTVYALGGGGNGQIGNGTTVGATAATHVLTGAQGSASGFLEKVTYVATGNFSSYALLSNGKVMAWGENGAGQCGDGTTTTPRTTPVYVLTAAGTPLTNVIQIGGMENNGVALRSDGTVWIWGDGGYGQANVCNGPNVLYAVQVTGLPQIVKIGPGDANIFALGVDGYLWAWGRGSNYAGMLALASGNQSDICVPERVMAVGSITPTTNYLTGIEDFDAGQTEVLCRMSDGRVVGWGDQMGDGLASSSDIPRYVKDPSGTGDLDSIAYIGAGDKFCMAMATDGTLYTWGANNADGQLGLGSLATPALPVAVSPKPYKAFWNCPLAYLGPDVTLCNPLTASLYAGSTSATYKYEWYKDGVLLSDPATNYATGAFFTANAPGTYKVVITDTSALRLKFICPCPPVEDQVIISTSTVSPINGTFCTTPTATSATLAVNNPGNTFDWYSTSTGGTVLAGGSGTNTYTTPNTLTSNTTYYVQDTRTYTYTNASSYLYPPTQSGLNLTDACVSATHTSSRAAFNVQQTLTLVSVDVYKPSTGSVSTTMLLVDLGNAANNQTINVTLNGASLNTVPINLTLPPGNYVLEWSASFCNARYYQYAVYPTGIAGLISFSDASTDFSVWTSTFFNWNITAKQNCGRIPVVAQLITNCAPPCTPPAYTSPASISRCEGVPAAFTASVPGDPSATYQWQLSINGGLSFSNISGATATGASSTYTIPAASVTYSLNNNQYRAYITTSSCAFPTSGATLTVVKPVITSASLGTVCTGVAQSYDITSDIPSTYSWSRAAVTNISNSALAGQTADPITEALINTSTSPVNVVYSIMPTSTSGSCPGFSKTYTVTVNPGPDYTLPATTCANTNIVITGTGPQAANYTWSNTGAAGSFGTAASTFIYNGTLPKTLYVKYPATTYITGNTDATQHNANNDGDTRFELFTPLLFNSFQVRARLAATSGTIVLQKLSGATWANTTGTEAWSSAFTTGTVSSLLTFTPYVTLSTGTYRLILSPNITGASAPLWKNNTLRSGNRDVSGVISVYGDTQTGATSAGGSFFNLSFDVPDPCGIRAINLVSNCCVAPTITTQPASASRCVGAGVSFTVGTSASSPTYQWQVSTNSGGSWANVTIGTVTIGAGGTTSTYTLANSDVTSSINGYQYRAVVTSSSCFANSTAATLTVNALPTINSAAAGNICSGVAQNYTITSAIASSYSWSRAAVTNITEAGVAGQSSNPITETLTNTTSSPINVTYVITPTSTTGSCVGPAFNYVVTVNPGPVITAQPTATTNICVGSALNLSVTAIGTSLSYQWQKGGVNIGSATNSTYNIPAVALTDGATYTVLVSGNCGNVTSANAVVNVNGVTITTQPASQTVCAGATPAFSATATGPGLTYQWQQNPGSGFNDLAGETSASYTSPSATTAMSGYSYRVVIKSNNMCTLPSGSATLTVNPATIITAQPATPTNICVGSALNLSVTATGISLSYQWQKGGVNIGSATNSTYNIPVVALTDGATYTVLVSGTCGNVTSANAVVNVNGVTITTQPASQTVCAGATPAFSVTATGPGLTYQWQQNPGSGFNDLAGETSASYTSPSATTAMSGYSYRVVIKSNNMCTLPSGSATLTVNPATIITAQPAATTNICVGSALNLSITATGTSLIYQWQKGGVNIGSATNSTYSIPVVALTDGATYTVVVSGTCGNVTSANAVVNVNGVTITTQPASQTVCAGATPAFSVTATGPGLTYQWQQNTGSGFNDLAGETSASYTSPSATTAMSGYSYQVVIKSNNMCTLPSGSATLTVNPATIITAQPASPTNLCTGSPLSLATTATGTSITYQWNLGGTPVLGAISSSYNVAFVAFADSGTYTVTVSGSCGTVTSGNALVHINGVISTQPADQGPCVGGSATFSVTASGPGLTYQWQENTGSGFNNIAGANSSGYTIPSVTAGMNGYTYNVIVQSNGSCGFTSGIATLTINTSTTINTQPASQGLCLGSSMNLSVNVSGSGVITYQWKKAGAVISGATSSTYSIPVLVSGDAGSYTVDVSSDCGPASSNAAVITINNVSITAGPANQIVCENANHTFTVTATGLGTLSYQWQTDNGTGPFADIAGETSSTLTLTSISLASNGYQYRVIIRDDNLCPATSAAATLTVNPLTVISTQPSGATLCAGSILNLNVGATGTGTLGYQWKLNGSPISNATSSTYTVASVSGTDAGSYTVDITGGCSSPTSSSATITINGVTITREPSSQIVCENTNHTFTVSATGLGTLTYQWQTDNGTGTFADIAGETSSTLSLASISLASDGFQYRVQMKDDNLCPATSASATLTVTPLTVITTQPSGATLCAGSILNLNVGATGTGTLGYQWNLNGSPISNATSSTYTVASVSGPDAGSYTVHITGGCSSPTSSPVTVTINGVTITGEPVSQVVCENANATFTVVATGLGTLTYQWQTDNGTGTFADISGEVSSSLVLASVSLASDGFKYLVIMQDDNLCPATSTQATLTVTPLTVITTQPSGTNLCAGSALNLNVVATGTGTLGYQWNLNSSPISNATSSTYTVASVSGSDAGSYTVDITGGCSSPTSSPVTVTINGVTITGQPTSQVVCENANATFTVAATGLGTLTYQWQTDNGTGTFADISGELSSSLILASVSLSSDGFKYRVIMQDDNLCPATSAMATLTVTPLTVITTQPSGATLCAGSILNLNVGATGTGTLGYQWNLNGTPISNATSSTYTVASVSGTDAGSYTVDITGGCSSPTSSPVTVTINGVTITGGPSSQVVCENANATFTVTATGLGTLTYQWQTDNGTGTFAGIAGETSSTLTLSSISLTLSGYQYRVIIRDNNLCPATSVAATLTANPLTAITTQPSGANLCAGSALNLNIVATGTGALGYQWKLNGSPISSATSSTYTIASVGGTDAGSYAVDITGGCGNLTSSLVAITVNGVTINTNPANQTACENANATFTVAAIGLGTLTYQWQTDNGTGAFADMTGKTSSTLALNGVSLVSDGFQYRVIMRDDNFCPLTSATAILDVLPSVSSTPISAGADIITCNDFVVLGASPAGGTWSILTGTGTFVDINDDTTKVTGLASLNKFVWTLSNSCGSASATVSVTRTSGNMAINATTSKDTTCAGQEITITAAATGGSGSYTYTVFSLDGLTNASSDSPVFSVSPAITSRYVVFATDKSQAGCVSNNDSVEVFAISAQVPFMANLITPNNDGKNDKLMIRDVNGNSMLDASSLVIYNRWGTAVFKSEDYKNDFEGEGLPDGVYYLYHKAGCGGKESKTWIHVIRE